MKYLTAANAMIPIQYGTSSVILTGRTKDGSICVLLANDACENDEFVQSTDFATPPTRIGGIMQIMQIMVAVTER